ncbi:hypothetical protein [Streptomyces sp. NPDC001221]
MRRTTTVILLAAGLALAGCSSSASSSTTPGPAQKLADLDGDVRPVDQYQKALDAWATRCSEGPEQLAGYAYATVEDLQKHGVTDETEYSALVHLKDAVPAGTKTKCEDIAASYLILRENGKS